MSDNQKKVREIIGYTFEHIPDWVYQSAEPLLLKGLVAEWEIVKKSQQSNKSVIEYLQGFYNGRPVTYYFGEPDIQGRLFYNEDYTGYNFQRFETNLNSVLDLVEESSKNSNPPTIYVGSTRVDEWLPGFRKANNLCLKEGIVPLVSIWLGNKSIVAAHYDCPDNLACSVAGKRTFTLFPPEQLENLYVGSLDITPSGRPVSMVDLLNPDFEKFPKFKDALSASLVAELQPGDALFIPGMWWHHVHAQSQLNVLVNYWWRNTPPHMGNPEYALQHAILSLKNLPDSQKEIWKRIFDFYVFNTTSEATDHIPASMLGSLGVLDESLSKKIRSNLVNALKR